VSEARRKEGADWIGVFNTGVFIILLGVTWAINPGLSNEAISFFNDFQMVEFSSNVLLPAPANNHPALYRAAANLMLIFGLFQMVILGLRIILGDTVERKIDTASGMVFLLALSLFLNMLANEAIGWVGFIGGFLVCIGLSIVTSATLKLFRR